MRPYEFGLGVVWCVVWFAAALTMSRLPLDLRAYHLRRWHPWSVAGIMVRATEYGRLLLPTSAGLFLAIYVLGYSPYRSAIESGRLSGAEWMNDFYVPVQWVMDETPLHEPLLRWADRWGERDPMQRASEARTRGAFWGAVPAWLYATGWIALGLACVLAPGWALRRGALFLMRRQLPLATKGRAEPAVMRP